MRSALITPSEQAIGEFRKLSVDERRAEFPPQRCDAAAAHHTDQLQQDVTSRQQEEDMSRQEMDVFLGVFLRQLFIETTTIKSIYI